MKLASLNSDYLKLLLWIKKDYYVFTTYSKGLPVKGSYTDGWPETLNYL